MTSHETLKLLMKDFADAHFDCGAAEFDANAYREIWKKAEAAEAALLEFLEPYLPKD